MCGIVAYMGHRQAHEVIIKGLKRLEYRGYDSAGIALLNGGLNVYKKKARSATSKNSSRESSLRAPLELATRVGLRTVNRMIEMPIPITLPVRNSR